MTRPLRLEFPGALYHVTVRGNDRQDIYLDDADRLAFLRMLGDVADRTGWICHVYCLMTNHYHLVVETPDPNLGKGMQRLNSRYGQWFNRNHDRVGHLFQGRYKAILVQKEGYLMQLARYVVLNPVRAGIVSDPRAWRWSSYRATIGEVPAPRWLATDWLLSQFGTSPQEAIVAYREFVDDGLDLPSIWTNLQNQIYLGSDGFVKQMEEQLGNPELIGVPQLQLRPTAKPLSWYAKTFPNRNEAMAKACLSGGYSKKSVASHFGVPYRTVTRAVRRIERLVE